MRDAFELDFVYLDPILSEHMKDQGNPMIGRGLLEFIHPEVRQREGDFFFSSYFPFSKVVHNR